MTDFNQFIGKTSKEDFFSNYWQKKVLVVRDAFKNASNLASFSDFQTIGQDERYETRLVMESSGEYPWQAQEGPFRKDQLNLKSKKCFTLIIHSLNLYFKEFYQFQKMVNFLPTWLFDDVMATYSNAGATVGAHIDNYNVFILQGKGTRKWQIQNHPDPTYIENLDIKLLENFTPQDEYILEEGDMIYIPPQVAHNGISLTDSLSYSIGFRAFNYKDMIFSYFNDLLENYSNYDFFKMNQQIPNNPNEVTSQDFDQINKIFKTEILNPTHLKNWFGCYTSEPRVEPENFNQDSIVEIEKNILNLDFTDKDTLIFKDEHFRMTYLKSNNQYHLFLNGEKYIVSQKNYLSLEKIFSSPAYLPLSIPAPEKRDLQLNSLLVKLYNRGSIFFEERMEEDLEEDSEEN